MYREANGKNKQEIMASLLQKIAKLLVLRAVEVSKSGSVNLVPQLENPLEFLKFELLQIKTDAFANDKPKGQ